MVYAWNLSARLKGDLEFWLSLHSLPVLASSSIHDCTPTMTLVSIGTPAGPNSTTCGYCSAPGERSQSASSYLTAGLDARTLSCTVCLLTWPVGAMFSFLNSYIRE